jgi:sugar lactone lactonase YvrE
MNKVITVLLTGFILVSCSSKNKDKPSGLVDKKTVGILPTEKQPELMEVAQFKGAQVTGVTVSKDGRMFANFPRWRENIPFSVVEVKPNGTPVAYPDETWNTWNGKPEKNHFTCVQSVYAHGNNLYVLDPSSPEMKGVQGRAKLYRFDLASNKLTKTWEFDSAVAPEKSYLNDLRIDDKAQRIFITDSGLGGIVVLDMKSGAAKRVLDKHPSTKSENITLTVDKKEFSKQIHSDGIALSPVDNKLYYHALTGYTLYRVPSEALETNLRDETKIVKQVEKLGVTPAPDGMMFDKNGNLFMADLERNAISYRTPDGDMKILIQDERIKWADTFAIDNDNNLIFTDSLLQDTQPGQPVDDMTFRIYKVELPKASI